MKKIWFSAAKIAAERLPGMPGSDRGVRLLAEREKWGQSELSRKRSGEGAGLEYHFTLLPEAAQTALIQRYAPAAVAETKKARKAAANDQATPATAAWARYDGLPGNIKGRAAERLELLLRVETVSRRLKRGAAIRAVAEESGISLATLHNWFDMVRGVPRCDWLPALAPAARGGGGRPVEVDERFWDAFRADYLRASEPSFKSCYRRTCGIATVKGWAIPNERTLRRRVDAIPDAVLTMARKGRDATKAMFPAQERDRGVFHALEAVNADGHKWDVFCRWPDGRVGRPLMVAFQDLYSGMFLAWRTAQSENQDLVRLTFGDMIETYGVPDHCWLDNGRAFAGKMNTGGIPNRYRFKVKAEEPDGVFKQLGVQVHWTTPYAGQSKPIERGFRDFAQDIAKHPAFQGAYCGNSPDAKPEDYGTRAIPIDEFIAIVNDEIAKHNARPGRQTKVCGGKLSFQEAFDLSYAASPIRMASPEQRRMCMLAIENVKPRRVDGSIILLGNRYWNEKLLEYRGKLLTVRFDPDDVQKDLAVHAQDGTLICIAQLVEAVGFADTTAAREHAQARNAYLRATRERLEAERKMSLKDLVALQPKADSYEPPETKIIRPLFTTGNLAMKPAAQAEADEDDFDMKFAKGLRLVRGNSSRDF